MVYNRLTPLQKLACGWIIVLLVYILPWMVAGFFFLCSRTNAGFLVPVCAILIAQEAATDWLKRWRESGTRKEGHE
jgi:apolipoprotein N-acyltransferase